MSTQINIVMEKEAKELAADVIEAGYYFLSGINSQTAGDEEGASLAASGLLSISRRIRERLERSEKP